MVYLISKTTLLSLIIAFKYTDASPVAVGDPTSRPEELPEQITTDSPQDPPCCKEYIPPPPYQIIPRPNRFREGVCKEGNITYQAGDTWNYDPECVEHECKEDGTIVVNKCPPEPESIPEGWELITDTGEPRSGPASYYPFCCKRAVPPPNPKEPGCYVSNRTVGVGVQVDIPGRCYMHICRGNNEWFITDCGNIASWDAWEILPGDTSKSYPDCCGKSVPILDIVPDVLDDLSSFAYLGVAYGSTPVDYGNQLTPAQVRNAPSLNNSLAPGEPTGHQRYLLLMTDPDASNREAQESKEFLHWMVGNFRGNEISSGDTLAEYIGAAPPKGSGMHRYIFFLFEQPDGRLDFEELHLDNTTVGWRGDFSTRKFAKKYNLGDPIGFNVFRAQWDESESPADVVE